MNNNQNNGCGCSSKPENIDIQMDVCDRNISMLPMLQTYTTKVLQPNINCCKKNILTQEMLSCEKYKYVIKWDFDLNGETIIIPEGCVLEFDGGSLSNGYLTLSDNCSMIGRNKKELNEVSVDMRGTNIHINHIDTESSLTAEAFRHTTVHGKPNDYSNLVIENCRITTHGISGAGEANSGGAIYLGTDYEEGLIVNNITVRNNVILHRKMGVEFCNHYHPDPSDIYGQNTDTLRIKNITIENNYIKCIAPETTYGFNISISGRISNVRITDNTLIDGRQTVEVAGHVNHIDVLNNTHIHETDVDRWYFFNWAATVDEYGEDYNLIGNTFKGNKRYPLFFLFIKNMKISDNHFFSSFIRFINIDDVEITSNYFDLLDGWYVLKFNGTRRVNVCYNTILNGFDAYLIDFQESNDIDPSDNTIAHNFYKRAGNTYSLWRQGLFSTTNFVYDNVDMTTGRAHKSIGTTAERPDKYMNVGYKYFNTEYNDDEMWDGTAWVGHFTSVPGISPFEVPNSALPGMLYIRDGKGSKLSVFPVTYYQATTTELTAITEITQNNAFTVVRSENGGNVVITRTDPEFAEIPFMVCFMRTEMHI